MLERDIEKHLVKRCDALDVLCEKFRSPQRVNVPDRILTHKGVVLFLELKATRKKPNEGQARDHRARAKQGANVLWTDSIEGVDAVLGKFEAYRYRKD